MRKKMMAWLLVLTLTIANSNLVYAVDTAPQERSYWMVVLFVQRILMETDLLR